MERITYMTVAPGVNSYTVMVCDKQADFGDMKDFPLAMAAIAPA